MSTNPFESPKAHSLPLSTANAERISALRSVRIALLILLVPILFLTIGCTNQEKNKNSLEHNFGSFGDSMETIRKNLERRCSKIEERELGIILSTAKHKQTQLECYDLVYRGKKRFVEFMFSDNKLEIIHIMKTESDHDELKAILAKKYGKPSYTSNVVDYYSAHGISLRTKPYEISFHSSSVKVEYDGYMKSLE